MSRKKEWKNSESRSNEGGKTHHDNHNSFNTPPNTGSVVMIRKPMESSSRGGIFFGLILSFTAISSISLSLGKRDKESREGKKGLGETGGRYRNEEENVHHGIVGQWMTIH